MDFKGTQFEWELHPTKSFSHGRVKEGHTLCFRKGGELIAFGGTWTPFNAMSAEEELANAQVMVCSPEMLEMLKSIVSDFESDYVVDGIIVDEPYKWLIDRYKEAKQLIKKATGNASTKG